MKATGVRDMNRDGTPEVIYSGYNGGGGRVPFYFGIYGWTGTSKVRRWSYSARGSGLGGRYSGASYDTRELDERFSGPEIRLEEGVLSRGDAGCCPSRLRITYLGYNGASYVPYGRFYEEQ